MKISIAIGLFFAGSTHLFAQSLFPKVGVSSSWIATSDLAYTKGLNDDQETKVRIGFTAGIGVNIPLDEIVSIQPELSFIQKGTIGKMHGGNGEPYDDTGIIYWESTRNIKINYVELPVLMKLSFGKKTKFFVNMGPAMALGLGGTSTFTSKYDYHQSPSTVHTKEGKVLFTGEKWEVTPDDERFKSKFDFGFHFGGGMLILRRIMIDIRYGHGISNLYESEPSFENKAKNRTVQMTIGVPLKL
jgi:hypothetical protein